MRFLKTKTKSKRAKRPLKKQIQQRHAALASGEGASWYFSRALLSGGRQQSSQVPDFNIDALIASFGKMSLSSDEIDTPQSYLSNRVANNDVSRVESGSIDQIQMCPPKTKIEISAFNNAMKYIGCANTFEHEISEGCDYTITSFDLQANLEDYENIFENKFEPDTWTILNVVRQKKNSPYYSDDVLRYQYEMVAERNEFVGRLPNQIIVESVCNEATIQMTENASAAMLAEIFSVTPVGKLVFRLMKHYGLECERVQMQAEDSFFTYIVWVRPHTT